MTVANRLVCVAQYIVFSLPDAVSLLHEIYLTISNWTARSWFK